MTNFNTLKLIGLLIITALFGGCASMKATPVTDPPSQTKHVGKFIWHDMLTSDVEMAKKFYASLFGWTFRQVENYIVVLNNGKPIAGMVQVDSASEQSNSARWLASLSVADVEIAATVAIAAGALIHEGPEEIENRGQYALISDPNGAQLVLLNSSSGDPEDSEPEIGSWLWNELWTENAPTAINFYQEIVGYETITNHSEYDIAVKKDKWRAGIRPIAIEGMNSRWIPVIRVKKPEHTAKLAEMHGGHVLIPADQAVSAVKVALIADPAGALFMVQNWSNTEIANNK